MAVCDHPPSLDRPTPATRDAERPRPWCSLREGVDVEVCLSQLADLDARFDRAWTEEREAAFLANLPGWPSPVGTFATLSQPYKRRSLKPTFARRGWMGRTLGWRGWRGNLLAGAAGGAHLWLARLEGAFLAGAWLEGGGERTSARRGWRGRTSARRGWRGRTSARRGWRGRTSGRRGWRGRTSARRGWRGRSSSGRRGWRERTSARRGWRGRTSGRRGWRGRTSARRGWRGRTLGRRGWRGRTSARRGWMGRSSPAGGGDSPQFLKKRARRINSASAAHFADLRGARGLTQAPARSDSSATPADPAPRQGHHNPVGCWEHRPRVSTTLVAAHLPGANSFRRSGPRRVPLRRDTSRRASAAAPPRRAAYPTVTHWPTTLTPHRADRSQRYAGMYMDYPLVVLWNCTASALA